MENENVLKITAIINNEQLTNDQKKQQLLMFHENDIADALVSLPKEKRLMVYEILGNELSSDVFSYIDDDVENYVKELDYEKAADLIEQMDADDAVDVLDEVSEEDKSEILKRMEGEIVDDIKLISSYDDEQIGSHMTTNFIAIKKNSTVPEAMKEVIKEAGDHDNVGVIYVLNDDDTFYGAIQLRDLIRARKEDPLDSIIKKQYPTILATSLISENVNELRDYVPDSIPVINQHGQVVGSITSDDIIESLGEEFSEDYAKLGGLSKAEDLEEPVFKSVWKRIPWLVTLLILGLLISLLISSFEQVFTLFPVIILFQSTILDMAGNVGTQSLAVTIRVLTVEDDKKILHKTVSKEIKVGFLNGLFLGILSFGVVLLFLIIRKPIFQNNLVGTITEYTKTAGVVSFSMFMAMGMSSFFGSLIPIVFKKIKIDPAVASGPFITTINDIIAVLIYYGITTLMFMVIK